MKPVEASHAELLGEISRVNARCRELERWLSADPDICGRDITQWLRGVRYARWLSTLAARAEQRERGVADGAR